MFKQLWPVLRRFCSSWLAGAPEAEDCAQSAISRVFAQAAFFDSKRDAVTWALELAVWECRTVRSQQRRARTGPLSLAASQTDRSNPAEALQQAQLQAALAEALIELLPGDQEALRQFLEEQSAGDPAARKRRQRALARLKILWRRLPGND